MEAEHWELVREPAQVLVRELVQVLVPEPVQVLAQVLVPEPAQELAQARVQALVLQPSRSSSTIHIEFGAT